MEAEYRIPKIRVIVKRPNWEKTDSLEEYTVVIFESTECHFERQSNALLSYSYSESIKGVTSPFTLSLTPEQDKDKLTWADKIDLFDLVFIEEFGKVRYMGIVHRIRYSSRMGEDGPERTIMIDGDSFGGLLSLFQLVINTSLFIHKPVDIENLEANSEFISNGDTSLQGAINFYYNNFKKIISERGDREKQSVVGMLIDKYLEWNVDKNCNTLLPICQNMYQMGVNTIWDILRKIVPEPMYELFGRWDTKKNKYVIIARQCPYSDNDWKSLPIHTIKPIVIKSIDVGRDDSDMYTVFYATAPSFGYTNNISITVDNIRKNMKINDEKWNKFGYRPLSVELSFLKRDNIEVNDLQKSLNKIGELLESWHKNNDSFLCGSISVISYEDSDMEYPVIGERLGIMGGEFYIDEIQRKWIYGNSPTSEIKVLRGAIYRRSGEYGGPIPIGRRMHECGPRDSMVLIP